MHCQRSLTRLEHFTLGLEQVVQVVTKLQINDNVAA